MEFFIDTAVVDEIREINAWGVLSGVTTNPSLIVASGLLALLALFEHPADGFRVVGAGAGHSVGEITAASAAGGCFLFHQE